MATTPKQIKKLSVATVYGKIDLKTLLASKLPQPETLHVMRVIGSAVTTKTGTSSYGDWTALQGQFECMNPETGEIFAGSTLFLPDVALTPILVGLSGPEARGVEFAFDILCSYAHDAKPGGSAYEYTFVPLLPPDQGDPVTRLKAKLLALAAPASEPDPAPAPEPAPAPTPKVKR